MFLLSDEKHLGRIIVGVDNKKVFNIKVISIDKIAGDVPVLRSFRLMF